MPVLPTTQNMQRAIPQPSRGVTGIDLTQTSKAMQQFGSELQQVGAGIASQEISALREDKKINDEYELATANAMITQADVQSQSSLRDEPDYTKHASLYSKSMEVSGKQAADTIRDQRLRALFEIKLQNEKSNGLLKIDELSRAKEKDAQRAYLEDGLNNTANLASQTDDSESRQRLIKSQIFLVNAAVKSGHVSQEEGAQKIRTLQAIVDENAASRLPPEEKVRALSSGSGASDGSKETSINKVLDLERGYDPNGGNNGKPAVFGIDQHFFPKDFEEVNALYQSGDKEGARKLAYEFYDEKFWKANDTESIPANTRDIVLDAMVMSGSDNAFIKNLSAKAKNGASREELLSDRQDFYNSLIDKNPEKYGKFAEGWSNRLKSFSGGEFPNIPADTRTRMLAQAKIQLSSVAVSKLNDAKSIISHGGAVEDSVFDAIIQQANMLDNPELSAEIVKVKTNKNELVRFNKDSLDNNFKEIQALQKTASTDVSQADKLQMLSSSLAKKQELISQDARGYYETAGEITPAQNIFSLQDSNASVKEMEQRQVSREYLKKNKNIDVGVLTKEEMSYMDNTMKNGTVDAQANMVAKVQAVLDPDSKTALAAQLSQTPTLAAAFMLDNSVDITNVLTGAKTNIPVKITDLDESVNKALDGLLFDNNAKNISKEGVINIYKALHNVKSPTISSVDDGLMQQALKSVVGNVAVISPTNKDSKIILREHDDPDDIDYRLHNLTNDQLKSIAGGLPKTMRGSDVTAADIRNHAIYYSREDGKLGIRINGETVLDQDKKPYVIDIDKLKQLKSMIAVGAHARYAGQNK